jgi:hypothetical protein
MSAGIDVSEVMGLFGKVVKVRSGALQKELVDNLHAAASPIEADMRAAAKNRIMRRAMGSVHIDKLSDGLEMSGGGGGGLAADLFAGAEFGGQSGKRRIVRASVFGRPTTWIKKRVTMQFEAHLGPEGYFFYPTVNDWMPKLEKQSAEIVAESLGGR